MENERARGSKPSVLYVISDQFGYSAGYYYYCKYLLKAGFRVGVICLDDGKKKMELEGDIEIYYIKPRNVFHYRLSILRKIKRLRDFYDTIVLKQFFGLLPVALCLDRTNVIFDIRTGSVRQNALMREMENLELKFLARLFSRVFILSHELASELRIPKLKYTWLPLGADEIAHGEKHYAESMKLLYVGTFASRNIHQAVEGFALFFKKNSDRIDMSFDIIGKGSEEETRKIIEVIERNNLDDVVVLHGYLPHQEASEFFEKCNIGISHIPMISCFENQPPTKTYEYIISGLVCLGTDTTSNRQLINPKNGILYNDNAVDFCRALEQFYENRNGYHTQEIKKTLQSYKWEEIVNSIIIPSIAR